MDVIHLHIRTISRAKGSSAVGTAAYCSGEKLHNERNDRLHDFTNKYGIVYSKILLPDNAPRNLAKREILWNTVEQIEKSKNALLAREVEVSLPVELDRTEQISLITAYVQESFVNHGMCADICIHDKGTGNPHAHIMLTTRSMDENGNWLSKQNKNYILDENGKKIYDPVKKQYKCGKSSKSNNWDNKENAEKWRQEWAKACNREFERKGLEKRVTHESYKRQGNNRIPTKHLGYLLAAQERCGIETERGKENRAIQLQNRIQKERERRRQQEREQNRERRRQTHERTR